MDALTTTQSTNRGGARVGAGRKANQPGTITYLKQKALELMQGEIAHVSPILTKALLNESIGTYVILRKNKIDKDSSWEKVKDDLSLTEYIEALTDDEGELQTYGQTQFYYLILNKEKPNVKALEIALSYTFGKPNQTIKIEESDLEKREKSAIFNAFRQVLADLNQTPETLSDDERTELARSFGEYLVEEMDIWNKLKEEG